MLPSHLIRAHIGVPCGSKRTPQHSRSWAIATCHTRSCFKYALTANVVIEISPSTRTTYGSAPLNARGVPVA